MLQVGKMSRLIRRIDTAIKLSYCSLTQWTNLQNKVFCSKVLTLIVPQALFLAALLSLTPNVALNFFICIAQTPISVCIEKRRPCPLPLNHPLPSLTLPTLPLPPIFCLSHHQTKISVMKTSAGQLVRGLEMEIEKLKGSERSVCARITAHFITGRNGQIWHKIKKKRNTICHVFLA